LSFLFLVVWGILAAIILALVAREIASLFNGDSAVVAIAAAYLTIVPISFAAYGIFLISSSTFNALGKPLPSVVMTLSRMLLLYVLLAYLGSWLFGIPGIFSAACFSNFAVGIGAFIWNCKTCSLRESAPRAVRSKA
jgi:Na+-driven multidrug efflux pump